MWEVCMEIEKLVYFYDYRKNCKCSQLNELWGQIKKVDNSQEEAKRYAEEYIKNPERYKEDVTFMNALSKRTNEFNSQILKYQDIFVKVCRKGHVVFEIEGKNINPKKFSKKEDYIIKCKRCDTRIPFLKYPSWNE